MTYLPLMTYFFGETIVLETLPVDPRDVFRGDYVVLRYEINEVPIDKFPEELRNWDTFDDYKNKKLYAVLKEEGNSYTVDYMSFSKPNNPYYLEAKLYERYPLENLYGDTVFVEYNIDRYFVPENTGKELEDASRQGELLAEVKVWNGYPLLVDIYPKE